MRVVNYGEKQSLRGDLKNPKVLKMGENMYMEELLNPDMER